MDRTCPRCGCMIRIPNAQLHIDWHGDLTDDERNYLLWGPVEDWYRTPGAPTPPEE